MRLSRASAALLALPTATLAVTLSDFTPRVSNLPTTCNTVYTQSIDGCEPSDFQDSCSKACVEALNDLTAQVKTACGNKGIGGSNIIVQFLNGNGPSSLCGDAAGILGSSTSATHAATSTSSSASSTSSSAASTSSAATSTTASASSTTSVSLVTKTVTGASSSATSSSSLIMVDTSTETATGTSTGQSSSQTNQVYSGGGSPFDAEGNTVSGGSISTISVATTVFTTILALAFTLR